MEQWKGIGKLIEECGEVQQVAGKVLAFPRGPHPDGKGSLHQRFIEELADLQAAIEYFTAQNCLSCPAFERRRARKLQQFYDWGLTGIATQQDKGVIL